MRGLSVIICTYNPRIDTWKQVISSIGIAMHAIDRSELIIVDNASVISVRSMEADYPLGSHFIDEPRQGVYYARKAGAHAAQYEWVLFVDDDNILAADYIRAGMSYVADHPQVGLFGGKISLSSLLSHQIGWQSAVLDLLAVRDFGEFSIEYANSGSLSPLDPPTAGMFVRAKWLCQFFESFTVDAADGLGRGPDNLSGGEDSLLVQYVLRKGLLCGYCPNLLLTHMLDSSRLHFRYLVCLGYSMGCSHAKISRMLELPTKEMNFCGVWLKIPYHLIKYQVYGLRAAIVKACWKLGFNREISRHA